MIEGTATGGVSTAVCHLGLPATTDQSIDSLANFQANFTYEPAGHHVGSPRRASCCGTLLVRILQLNQDGQFISVGQLAGDVKTLRKFRPTGNAKSLPVEHDGHVAVNQLDVQGQRGVRINRGGTIEETNVFNITAKFSAQVIGPIRGDTHADRFRVNHRFGGDGPNDTKAPRAAQANGMGCTHEQNRLSRASCVIDTIVNDTKLFGTWRVDIGPDGKDNLAIAEDGQLSKGYDD